MTSLPVGQSQSSASSSANAGDWRLEPKGALIAVVGGDGAGKTTVVAALACWLGQAVDTRVVHLGKPPKSVASLIVKGTLLLARRGKLLKHPQLGHYPTLEEHGNRFPGYAWVLWQLMTARDRSRGYARAKRAARAGTFVVCDRFPLRELRLMDGARTRWIDTSNLPWPARRLVQLEQQYYARISAPDVLVVLRVDPDVAVARKTGVDSADFVRPRSAEVFGMDWSGTAAHVLDASQPLEAVLDEIKSEVRRRLWAAAAG